MKIPSTTRDFQLTEQLSHYIDSIVASGQYEDASEIVREALRLLRQKDQEHQAKLEMLKNAVQKGLDQIQKGEGIVLENREARSRYFDDVERRVAAKAQGRNHFG